MEKIKNDFVGKFENQPLREIRETCIFNIYDFAKSVSLGIHFSRISASISPRENAIQKRKPRC